nr:fibronectin type III domain-containing protein [Prevotella sp.]
SNSCNIQLQPNKQYNFKITAGNNGGESFPSETLSAFYTPQATKTILVVNAFHRLASPEVIDNDSVQGFDIDKDAGVSYGLTAGWNGHQRDFDKKKMGVEGPGGLGYGDDDMVGRFVAGNDFNYSVTHTEAIAGTRKYNVVSCSSETILDGSVSLTNYPCIDFILGLERNDGYTTEYYKSFTPKMQSLINNYCNHGGNIIVSGAYIGSDMQNGTEKDFLKSALHVEYLSSDSDSIAKNEFINGLGMQFAIYNQLNPTHYADTNPEKFAPVGNAICAMQYSNGTCAAVGCQGRDRNSFVMGFPFECIRNKSDRLKIMSGILNYVISK